MFKHTSRGLTKDVVEEVAVIVVGFKSLIECRAALKKQKPIVLSRLKRRLQSITRRKELQSTYADFGINVTVVKLLIEDQENGVCIQKQMVHYIHNLDNRLVGSKAGAAQF